ncbi:MAG: hypothetical protein QXI32_04070 [Candidatus Bathyarchaeia archaeon]
MLISNWLLQYEELDKPYDDGLRHDSAPFQEASLHVIGEEAVP